MLSALVAFAHGLVFERSARLGAAKEAASQAKAAEGGAVRVTSSRGVAPAGPLPCTHAEECSHTLHVMRLVVAALHLYLSAPAREAADPAGVGAAAAAVCNAAPRRTEADAAAWSWRDDRGAWQRYDTTSSEKLERACDGGHFGKPSGSGRVCGGPRQRGEACGGPRQVRFPEPCLNLP
jgi:hypothetical protein